MDRLLPSSPAHRATAEQFKDHFVVLSDDDFGYFVRNATEVIARNALTLRNATWLG